MSPTAILSVPLTLLKLLELRPPAQRSKKQASVAWSVSGNPQVLTKPGIGVKKINVIQGPRFPEACKLRVGAPKQKGTPKQRQEKEKLTALTMLHW
jgi:hypothetical protein